MVDASSFNVRGVVVKSKVVITSLVFVVSGIVVIGPLVVDVGIVDVGGVVVEVKLVVSSVIVWCQTYLWLLNQILLMLVPQLRILKWWLWLLNLLLLHQ